MTAAIDASFNFTDLQGLSALRREAAADTSEARRAVAQQFEALFLQLMLSQMRNASSVDGGLIDQDKMRLHQDMLDNQMALTLSQGRGIGLADSILSQLDGPPARVAPMTTALQTVPLAADDPATFVDSIWPHAQHAARRLGVDPEVLVAQAALETGWGRSMPKDEQGRPSFNLFGIKAGSSWEGPRVNVSTLEYVDGVPERRREPFRVYSSPAESFADYVALLQRSPRYRQALEAGSVEGFAAGLQAGGYATDPHYADKLVDIVRRGLPGRGAQVAAAAADSTNTDSGRRGSRAGGEQT